MNNIGIIDIGSNTIHLLIVNIDNKYSPKVLDKDKEHLRLGSSLNIHKNISSEKILETITILKRYSRSCIINKVSNIIAVATEALRVAENSQYILDSIKKHTGLTIKVLSSKEEAFLSYLGVITTCNIEKGIIMDAGGNSTELISVEDNIFKNYISLPLGAINITENIRVNKLGKYISCDYSSDFFNDLFGSIPWINDFTGTSLIGIGGTFKNLNRIYTNHNETWYSQTINITSISPYEVKNLCSSIEALSLKEREKLKGLSKKRADIILGGCELITKMISYCNFNEVKLCNEGLRSGLLSSYLNH